MQAWMAASLRDCADADCGSTLAHITMATSRYDIFIVTSLGSICLLHGTRLHDHVPGAMLEGDPTLGATDIRHVGHCPDLRSTSPCFSVGSSLNFCIVDVSNVTSADCATALAFIRFPLGTPRSKS